jgi:hypothetical protein
MEEEADMPERLFKLTQPTTGLTTLTWVKGLAVRDRKCFGACVAPKVGLRDEDRGPHCNSLDRVFSDSTRWNWIGCHDFVGGQSDGDRA